MLPPISVDLINVCGVLVDNKTVLIMCGLNNYTKLIKSTLHFKALVENKKSDTLQQVSDFVSIGPNQLLTIMGIFSWLN